MVVFQSVKKQFSHEVIEIMAQIVQDQLEKDILEEAPQNDQLVPTMASNQSSQEDYKMQSSSRRLISRTNHH
uniref:Ovule protein n=1 Tax=Caenorhabditis tropicalis TaxID=1561998 RepID=A0A1I7TTS3_9PELO